MVFIAQGLTQSLADFNSYMDKRSVNRKRAEKAKAERNSGQKAQGVNTGHPVVHNHRLLAHRANVILPRGSDSRHKQQGRRDQIRHAVANDKIIVDRPMG